MQYSLSYGCQQQQEPNFSRGGSNMAANAPEVIRVVYYSSQPQSI
jgi:hypothetical protein